MKKLFVIFTSLIFVTALKAQSQPDLVARIHFLGGDKISADANSAAFAKEFISPQAHALENQTLDKLAKFFGGKFEPKSGATDSSAQLRPLLDDLLKSEWILEIRDAAGSPECALAIRLNSERTQLWSKNLRAVLQNWAGGKISQDRPGMWSAQNSSNSFQFEQHGDFVVIDFGQQLQLDKEILGPLMLKINLPETNWLSADLDWPRLAQLFPALREFDFPKVAFQIVGRDGNFYWTGKLNLSQPLPPLEPWRVPTNALHQPFVSFTAARGVAPWLEKQSWFQPYVVQPQPDQIFVWALPQVPFQTFAAEPVAGASAALEQLNENLSANQKWRSQFIMPIHMTLTDSIVLVPGELPMTHSNKLKPVIEKNGLLSFAGVPFIAPYIRAENEPDGQFLFGGFFPNTPRSQPLPAGLFTELNMPDLVYYHWEITGARLQAIPELSQLLLMITNHRQLPGGPAQMWLTNMTPSLGNCVTVATENSPTELSFTRKAPGGLAAIELLALADWLESPNFPSFDLRMPERPRLRPGLRPKIPGATMPMMSVPPPPVKK